MYRKAQPSTETPLKNHTSSTIKTNYMYITQSPWNPKTETKSGTLRGSLQLNSRSQPTISSTMTLTTQIWNSTSTTNSKAILNQEDMTTSNIATPKPTITTDSENLPQTLKQETPPTHVSALGSRKRKLMLSAKQSTKKVRKSCSTCGPSLAGKNSVAKRTAQTCSKCMPSLRTYFKPQ